MQAGQHAAGVVPTEGQDLLLHMMGVVLVEAALSPVIHLQHTHSTCSVYVHFTQHAKLFKWSFVLYLISFEVSSYLFSGDTVPVHLCQSAVQQHGLHISGSCSWHCTRDGEHNNS